MKISLCFARNIQYGATGAYLILLQKKKRRTHKITALQENTHLKLQGTQVSAAPPAYEKNGCMCTRADARRPPSAAPERASKGVVMSSGPPTPRSYFWQRAAWTLWMVTLSRSLLPLLDQGRSGGNVVSGLHGGVDRIIELYEKIRGSRTQDILEPHSDMNDENMRSI